MKNDFLVIGHRGASSEAPENTLKSFERAFELNADYIEFDLQKTLDNKIIISHDSNLLRTAGILKNLRDMSIEEVKKIDIGEGERIPTFKELIALTRGKIKLQPEIIAPGIVNDLIKVLREENLISTSIVSSFDITALLKVKEIEPGLKLGYLIPRALTKIRMVKRYLQRAIDNELYAIHPYYPTVNKEFIDLAHSHGLKVNVFTVNEEDMMKKLIKLSVDGIFTNDIALLNRTLGRTYQ
ncbi:MAG: glycerophosphodiester phosphodiesterase [Candidatus Lokiarchaeota archaeon]|nr:glycerophosphodiester phosphodiesterase [Candidatus Lokiarchaeota archaeon]